jgi:hypothetical protein
MQCSKQLWQLARLELDYLLGGDRAGSVIAEAPVMSKRYRNPVDDRGSVVGATGSEERPCRRSALRNHLPQLWQITFAVARTAGRASSVP